MDLDRCKQEIITRGFPELGKVRIDTTYRHMSDAYFEFTRRARNNYLIEVDTSLRHPKREVLIGGMSHEMAHISKEVLMGPIINFFDEVLCRHWAKYQTWDERQTDLLVIKRGLGKELLQFLKYADRTREDYNQQDGLTVREVEKLLQRS